MTAFRSQTLARCEALNPFTNRQGELELFTPLVGSSMLELGNKKNRLATYKAYFQSLGFRHVSVDWNGQDGALRRDLREPLNLGTFDMVSNIGTTEHVDGQEAVWKNICEAMHVGSVLVSGTPYPGDWQWHGEWYPTEEFYRELAEKNGLEIERLYVFGDAPRRAWMARMVRREACEFRMPEAEIYRNRRDWSKRP